MTNAVARLLAAGELLDAAQFCQRAGWSPDQVDTAVAEKRLFYVEKGRLRGYPAFFLDASLDRAQLEAVSQLLGQASGGTKWQFFVTPRGSLALPGKTIDGVLTEDGRPRTPLQALRDSDGELVMRAARPGVDR
ncbi:hypothetical protein [Roseateles sp.]|uniref:hypothetical protein n=1 Tax=Roseateles sp. TaxID=1971397 RepID=UPI0039EA9A4C